MFQDKQQFDLIMINMSSVCEWVNGTANRNRFILKYLAQRPEIGKILSVDFLPFTIKRAVRNYIENILIGLKGKILYRGLFDICVYYRGKEFQNKPIYVYSSIESIWSEKKVIKHIQKLSSRFGFQNILLWSYQPMFVGYFHRLGERFSVFDAVDNWYENDDYSTYRERLKKNYQYIAQNADIIFTVAEDLVSFFQKLGRREHIHWIPNGVDFDHYRNLKANKKFESFFKGLSGPIIGYIGTIQNRIDFKLIDYIANNHRDWNIILAGPTWPVYFKKFRSTPPDLKRMKSIENVFLLGRIPYKFAPYVIDQFDVGIIPHKINKFVTSMNPMKMYDYLARGKPIVSTDGAGLELFKDIIFIAKDSKEFDKLIINALETDTKEMQQKRIERVKQHTYEARLDSMMSIIYETLHKR